MSNDVIIRVKAEDHASKPMSGVGMAAKKMAAGAAIAALAVGVGLVKAMSAASKAAYESQKVQNQTNAAIKSTSGAANISAKAIGKLADSISRKTGIDDEAIQSSENLLLTFTNVRNEVGKGNDIFTRATKTVTDMSVALGQDMKSSSIQLGKALNDPIKGITALSRVGVSFTEEQKKSIKTLVEHGKCLEAQKIILGELKKEFGGSAEAVATWKDKLAVAAGNIQEKFGGLVNKYLEPIFKWFTTKGVPAVDDFLTVLGDMKPPKGLSNLFKSFKDAAAEYLPEVKKQFHKLAADAVPEMQGVADTINNQVIPSMQDMSRASAPSVKAISHDLGPVLGVAVKLAVLNVRWMGIQFSVVMRGVAAVTRHVVTPALEGIGWAMDDLKANTGRRILEIRAQFWDMAIAALKAARTMFSWIPGMKGKFDKAISYAKHARKRINEELANINNRTVTINFATHGFKNAIGQVSKVNLTAPSRVGGLATGGYVGANRAEAGGPRGGRTLVGERGPELVDLPYGSKVHSNGDSRRMAMAGGPSITVNAMSNADPFEIAREIAWQWKYSGR